MKVVHVLKKIEMIDNDIKELRKLEKTIAKDKSFSEPIYLSIEKQINIMLGERIKMLELEIKNPPAAFLEALEGKKTEEKEPASLKPAPKEKQKAQLKKEKGSAAAKKPARRMTMEMNEIPMLTQDEIDARFSVLAADKKKSEPAKATEPVAEETAKADKKPASEEGDLNVKLLDIALQKGNLEKKEIDREKEKKVRFFRENFPLE